MGSLYLRGKTWWMKYHINGQPVQKSTRTTKKMTAKEVLLKVENDIAAGRSPYTDFSRVYFEDLTKLFIQDYKINKKASLEKAERSVRHLGRIFAGYTVPAITTSAIKKFIEMRIDEKVANATINRELSALKRMLNLGANESPPIVGKVPKIKMLKEDNVRKGFFEHDEYLKIREALPNYLYGVITFAYKFGWRSTEITEIKWSQVDKTLWTVRIEGSDTKNNKGRTVYLDEEMKTIFQDLWHKRKHNGVLIHHVFCNKKGDGPIKCFRGAWDKAFEDTEIERRIFHDLRRTAVRNMVRAGIPENTAMKISGHKTRSVFDRYDIINDRDLINATRQQEEYMKKYSMGTVLATVGNSGTKKPLSSR